METSDLVRWKRYDRGIVIVVDTETTGLLDLPEAVPVELGAVALDLEREEIVGQFSTLIRPEKWRPAPPLYGFTKGDIYILDRIAQINPACLEYAPTASDALHALDMWLPSAVMGATSYNLAFDRGMLDRVARTAACCLPWDFCMMEAAREALQQPGGQWLSLVAAASRLGIEWPMPIHRAMADASLAASVGLALRKGGPPK